MKNFGIDPLACPAATKFYFLALAAEEKGKPSIAKDYRLRLFNSYMKEKNFNMAESFAAQNNMPEQAHQAGVQRAVSLNMRGSKN
ncbi:hypothetical protein COU37_05890 [Candidatus Micrarchaeota archaeon CG10_big_fil_rev_8_21_14_0_10_45_29]|nr:MAG: hypothetical protein COU37_05890 [Candidatus Micrarchaeota archaeon CG10_big_fil_rev_8_21_14_0_10_45_29]